MRFEEHEPFLLATDLPEHGLLAGMPGTVLLIHGDHVAYEVEFSNSYGAPVFMGALEPHLLLPYREDLARHLDVMHAMPDCHD